MRDLDPERLPRHIAIIPDGNGRWAEARGLPRNEGHHRGCDVVRDIVEACHDIGIPMLTVYAFSEENWARPSGEVRALMRLLERYLRRETDELARKGLRVQAVGNLDRLSAAIRKQVTELAARTQHNRGMQVTFAISYSGRTELVDVARKIARDVEAGRLDLESIDEKTVVSRLYAPDLPDPDLLIRSGAEYRISNFLLWQMAYTELYFCDALWPDFTPAHLRDALRWYQQRERRHGRTGAQVRSGA